MCRRASWIAALLVTAAVLAGCSSDDKTSTATTSTSEALVDDVLEGAGSSTSRGAPVADIDVSVTPLGQIVVDGEGMTLYAFAGDTAGTPTCLDACANAWPPLDAEGVEPAAALDAALFSEVTRPDGSVQVAFNGHPLYLFAGDEAPGDTAGQALNNQWFVVGVDGVPITMPAS